MADANRNKSSAMSRRQQLSRLQSRAPSSLQINRNVNWNIAIPLLSPLASSPPPQELKAEDPPQPPPRRQSGEQEKVIFKKWQHPAAPFCYAPAKEAPRFC